MPSELVIEYGPVATGECEPARKNAEYEAMSRLLRIVDAVKAWLPTVEDRLLKAYLVPQPEGLRLFAVARKIGCESSLLKSLSDFSIDLADADLDLDVTVIPDGTPDELRAFVEPDAALLLHWR